MNKNRLLCCRYVSHMSDLFEVEQLDKTDLPVTSRLGPLMQTMIGNLNLVLVMVPCLGEQVLNLYKQTCTTPKTWHLTIKIHTRHQDMCNFLKSYLAGFFRVGASCQFARLPSSRRELFVLVL